MLRFGRVYKRRAAPDADVFKIPERTKQHRETVEVCAAVENELLEFGRMFCDVIG